MADRRGLVEALWTGRGRGPRAARALLRPAEAIYGLVVGGRGLLYDWKVFRAESFSVPILSIGNLSVGGTGKTPIAAWFASRLSAKGVKPGIVLRGYGGDETIVHRRLNEGVPVIASADRVRGIR
ncbi:MAG TPA: tetraacyldisaccharide 4'-kinase, partial [Gemmatimonadaceae bacterium]|nr:tetraacyldisaccharide 4'-kinase [Gemmatimonadaceae bacterium]